MQNRIELFELTFHFLWTLTPLHVFIGWLADFFIELLFHALLIFFCCLDLWLLNSYCFWRKFIQNGRFRMPIYLNLFCFRRQLTSVLKDMISGSLGQRFESLDLNSIYFFLWVIPDCAKTNNYLCPHYFSKFLYIGNYFS